MYIIAEAGVNHNGSIELAKKLVLAAKQAGADAVKFQTFRAEKLASCFAERAVYQKAALGGEQSQQAMLKALELSYDEFRELKLFCDEQGIAFLSTPFELESLAFLETLDMPFWKVPSGEITNYPYLVEIGQTQRPVVLSTGMSTIAEVGAAVELLEKSGTPSLSLLHCTTQYPTDYGDVNLCAMDTLRERFHLPVGYSDHTQGIEVSVAAAARGAVILEKHFTLDRNMQGPDHKASLEPNELALLVQSVRHVVAALGDGIKRPAAAEVANMAVARKSIVAACSIAVGEAFTEGNLTVKRPGTGITPMRWNEVLGQVANRNFMRDELIEL